MQFDTVLFARREGIAQVTLNRPDRLNALNLALIKDLHAAAIAIDADAGIRAVVLTGAGRAFCSGADLMGEDFVNDPKQSRGGNIRSRLQDHFNPMVLAWNHLRVPVVVAVNGVSAGAGVSLAPSVSEGSPAIGSTTSNATSGSPDPRSSTSIPTEPHLTR